MNTKDVEEMLETWYKSLPERPESDTDLRVNREELSELITTLHTKHQAEMKALVVDFIKWSDSKIAEDNDYDFEDGGDSEYAERRTTIQGQRQSCFRQAQSQIKAIAEKYGLLQDRTNR